MGKTNILWRDDISPVKDEKYEFSKPVAARSIPDCKITRPKGLDRREGERSFRTGIYKGQENGEHHFVGRRAGNKRHLYHFFIKISNK